MKKEFSPHWIASKQPRKQRKYRAKAPLHVLGTFLHANVSKELRKQIGKRGLRVRKEDNVKIMRGMFKKKAGKVISIDTRSSRIFIENIQRAKKDGSKVNVPIAISNVQITALGSQDKERSLKTKTKEKTQE